MGAWGTGIFDNDDAMDWKDELCTSDGTDLLADAFAATKAGDLDAGDGARILCAAAALAVALGREVEGAPDLLKIWAAGLFEEDIRALLPEARAAVQEVLAEGSELKELWEGSDYGQWEATAQALLTALQ
jgi:hypothetical protein